MQEYDPDRTPDAQQWLALDEQLRIEQVERFHRAARIRLPNLKAHAAFHAIVENQIAEQHPPVVRAMERLAQQGLSRHERIHAIAWVLAQFFHEVSTTPSADADAASIAARYDAAVERLSAAGWRAQAEE